MFVFFVLINFVLGVPLVAHASVLPVSSLLSSSSSFSSPSSSSLSSSSISSSLVSDFQVESPSSQFANGVVECVLDSCTSSAFSTPSQFSLFHPPHPVAYTSDYTTFLFKTVEKCPSSSSSISSPICHVRFNTTSYSRSNTRTSNNKVLSGEFSFEVDWSEIELAVTVVNHRDDHLDEEESHLNNDDDERIDVRSDLDDYGVPISFDDSAVEIVECRLHTADDFILQLHAPDLLPSSSSSSTSTMLPVLGSVKSSLTAMLERHLCGTIVPSVSTPSSNAAFNQPNNNNYSRPTAFVSSSSPSTSAYSEYLNSLPTLASPFTFS